MGFYVMYTYTHIHTYIHTYIHACIHTCIHTYIHTYMHTYMHTYIHTYVHTCLYIHIHTYKCLFRYMAAPQKHRACNRHGRPFCDKACNRIGGSCDKPSLRQACRGLQYSTQRPATRVCNRGPATKVCNRGDRDKPLFRVPANIYMHIHK